MKTKHFLKTPHLLETEIHTFATKESNHANPNTLHHHRHQGHSREGEELQRLATIRQKVEEEGETRDVVRNCQEGGEIPLYWGDDNTFGVEINELQARQKQCYS